MPAHPRVLLVDDDVFCHRVVKTLLEESNSKIELEWLENYEDAFKRLRAGGIDVCLLDHQLGSHSGVQVLRTLDAEGIRTPVVMLTATNDLQTDLDAMAAGAVDYLVKGEFSAAMLERAVRYAKERARTLDRLRESEERYALAVSGSNDGIWDWKTFEKKLFISPRWQKLLGLKVEGSSGGVDELMNHVHPDDLERLKKAVNSHISGRMPFLEVEVRMSHADGNWHWVLVRGTAVRDARGHATRVAGSLTDITSARNRDPLTGLANRALFLDRMDPALARAQRGDEGGNGFACLFLDCDRFKVINDSLGHSAGDALLVDIARRLERCVRTVDTVARFGGDEFAVLLENPREPDGPARVAERIVEELAKPFLVNGREVFSGASVGIAMHQRHYGNAEEVLRDADLAMYRAKSAGRGRVAVFDEQMHQRAVKMLQMESELRQAINASQLEVYYQPIVTSDGELSAFEALVRWRHPTRGFVSPDDFIPLAEETGVVIGIDRWVMRQACIQTVAWRKLNPTLTISVNASHRQLTAPGAAEAVMAILEETGLEREALTLEVTESVISDHPQTVANLSTLKECGIRIVMDDFGTGFSSLASLHRLPFNGLKIDKTFIQRLTNGGASREVVRAILTLGHGLGMSVSAEGVETEAEVVELRALGCKLLQGFHFSRPVPANQAFERWLVKPK